MFLNSMGDLNMREIYAPIYEQRSPESEEIFLDPGGDGFF